MKQNYYFEKWIEAGSPDAWDFLGVVPYEHSEPFRDALVNIPAGSPTFARYVELENWQPHA